MSDSSGQAVEVGMLSALAGDAFIRFTRRGDCVSGHYYRWQIMRGCPNRFSDSNVIDCELSESTELSGEVFQALLEAAYQKLQPASAALSGFSPVLCEGPPPTIVPAMNTPLSAAR
jgi:hypothetical protein